MQHDKHHDEKVRLAGWTAGASDQDKSMNPHRGKKNDDETNWDEGLDQRQCRRGLYRLGVNSLALPLSRRALQMRVQ